MNREESAPDLPSFAFKFPAALGQFSRNRKSHGSALSIAAAMLALNCIVCRADTPEIIGAPRAYFASESDTLMDIARSFDTGFVELRIANPDLDPWVPGAGAYVTIPTQHLVPSALRDGIVINLPELRLYYFSATKHLALSFPIGIGDEGKETPLGRTVVVRKARHPVWVPTQAEHEEDPSLADRVASGPDNPMGDFALYLGWNGYAIHGSNKPDSIGRRDSHGCIRMYPEDIESLFDLASPQTPVAVVNQPAKAAWIDDTLYLEVHPDLSDIDAIEADGKLRSAPPLGFDELVLAVAGENIDRVDWDAVLLAELKRDGIPTPVAQRTPLPESLRRHK